MLEEINGDSGFDIIKGIGSRYKAYRKRMHFSQKEIAFRSGLSIFTISGFENGTATGISIASFIKLLRAIDLVEEMDKLLPELPVSPKEIYFKQMKKKNGI